ncbi:3'-5' exonuclease, partial [Rhizobium ruizarguesonis]
WRADTHPTIWDEPWSSKLHHVLGHDPDRDYGSVISFNPNIARDELEAELVRLIEYNIETQGISPQEVCVLAPQWVHLASMTRRLVAALPKYSFDGPGMVPFSRDLDNFWYKLSKIVLTEASPGLYVRRQRWAAEVVAALADAGADTERLTRKLLLKACNSIVLEEQNGLKYLDQFFDKLFANLDIDIAALPVLREHREAFFESSQARIDRLQREGAEFIGEIGTFRKVFEGRRGITVSTIHGVKGAEFDAVIAYALLEGMVPNFNEPNPPDAANKLLYVICSRARKNLHLISERGRMQAGGRGEYPATTMLSNCQFVYSNVMP